MSQGPDDIKSGTNSAGLRAGIVCVALSVVGPGTGYCQPLHPPLLPKPVTATTTIVNTGSPRDPADEKWRIQRRPLGRCCMCDLDICWGWGTLIHCLNSDEINEIHPPNIPNLSPGRMDPQPSGARTMATEPWRPPLEKRPFVLEIWSNRCPSTPSTQSSNQTTGNTNWAPPSTGASLAPVQNNE